MSTYSRTAKRQILSVQIALWSGLLIGNPPPYVIELRDRMRNYRPGDLVAETSTMYSLVRNNNMADDLWDGQLTRYLRTEQATIMLSEDDPFPFQETYLVCQQSNGTEYRWTNADLLAVPEGVISDWLKP